MSRHIRNPVPDGLEAPGLSRQKRSALRRRECQECGGRLTEGEMKACVGLPADHSARICNECVLRWSLGLPEDQWGGYWDYLSDVDSWGVSMSDLGLVFLSGQVLGMGALQYE